jgi:tRNA(fMet)-specific endonuclease VapC
MVLQYLLDTNIVSEVVKRELDVAVTSRLDEYQHICAIGSPTWQELLLGLQRMPQGARRQAVELYYQDVVRVTFPILSYDQCAAEWHAAEVARLLSIGRPATLLDGQLAAVAATNNLILVTRNVKDFSFYSGLIVEDWFAG